MEYGANFGHEETKGNKSLIGLAKEKQFNHIADFLEDTLKKKNIEMLNKLEDEDPSLGNRKGSQKASKKSVMENYFKFEPYLNFFRIRGIKRNVE